MYDQFGTCVLHKDQYRQYADLTAVDLDTLKPVLSEDERKAALAAVEEMIPRMERAAAKLSMKIPFNDAALAPRLERYKATRQDRNRLPRLEHILEHCGGTIGEMDTYTAIQLHHWQRLPESWVNRSNMAEFMGDLKTLRALRDILQGKWPDDPPASSEVPIFRIVGHFGANPAWTLLHENDTPWLTGTLREQCINDLRETIQVLTNNFMPIQKAAQLYLYEQASRTLFNTASLPLPSRG